MDDDALQLALARATLATIAEYATNLGRATGDWSVASPVLEMIAESATPPVADELSQRAEILQRHDCDPRTPIARATAELIQVQVQVQEYLEVPRRAPVWQLSVVGAPYGIFVRFCPFCGVELP